MYLLEKDAENTRIKTYADSLWWGVVSKKKNLIQQFIINSSFKL